MAVVNHPPASAGDLGFILGLGISSGEVNGNLLQYSCLGNPMGRGVWQAIQSMGLPRVRLDLVTKQQQQPMTFLPLLPPHLKAVTS